MNTEKLLVKTRRGIRTLESVMRFSKTNTTVRKTTADVYRLKERFKATDYSSGVVVSFQSMRNRLHKYGQQVRRPIRCPPIRYGSRTRQNE